MANVENGTVNGKRRKMMKMLAAAGIAIIAMTVIAPVAMASGLSDTGVTVDSAFLKGMMDTLEHVAKGFQGKVNDLVMLLFAPLATIYVIWTFLKAYLSERPISEPLAEVILTLLLVTMLINSKTYNMIFWKGLYGGVYDELVMGAGESTDWSMKLAITNLRNEAAEQHSKWIFQRVMHWAMSPGTALATTITDDFIQVFLDMCNLVTVPLLYSGLIFSVVSVTFYGAIGQIFLMLYIFEFTRDYTKRWFGCFMGALFSMVAIAYFMPFLANWNMLIKQAVNADYDAINVLTGPNVFKQLTWAISGMLAALKASSIGKNLFS